jgi:acetyltransferase-like isoleucine patch superfamily enzyme
MLEARLAMPLKEALCSDVISTDYFHGEGIHVMPGSFVTNDSVIGAHTYIGFNASITRSNIGRYVSIANRVSIGSGEHPLNLISTNSIFYESPYETLTDAPVRIEDDAWIGEASIIRRGVTLGRGCVVGAMSFVNRDVPAYAVVAGVPARVIRYRFSPQRIAEIEATQWWTLSPEQAREVFRKVADES